jgi:hypothetical protein
MFLKELNKKESIVFINLVQLLANTDDVFAKDEKNLIDDYIKELSLTDEAIENLSLEASTKELKTSTDRIKNIIYFELIGLALADGSFDDKELEFLNSLAFEFNISTQKQQDFVNYFKTVKDAYDSTVIDYESKIKSLEKSALSLL